MKIDLKLKRNVDKYVAELTNSKNRKLNVRFFFVFNLKFCLNLIFILLIKHLDFSFYDLNIL